MYALNGLGVASASDLGAFWNRKRRRGAPRPIAKKIVGRGHPGLLTHAKLLKFPKPLKLQFRRPATQPDPRMTPEQRAKWDRMTPTQQAALARLQRSWDEARQREEQASTSGLGGITPFYNGFEYAYLQSAALTYQGKGNLNYCQCANAIARKYVGVGVDCFNPKIVAMVNRQAKSILRLGYWAWQHRNQISGTQAEAALRKMARQFASIADPNTSTNRLATSGLGDATTMVGGVLAVGAVAGAAYFLFGKQLGLKKNPRRRRRSRRRSRRR